jgi:hypothetical protein
LSSELDEEIVAYVDGRLHGEARAAFDVRMANDPELARQVAAHRWMARQIVAAFGSPPGAEADAGDLARFGLASDNVVAFPEPHSRAVRRSVLAATLSSAIAAGLVAGVFADRTLFGSVPEILHTSDTGEVLAQGELADSLSSRLSGAPGAVRIGLTFRTAHTVCRTFSTASGISGLGCRDGQRWSVPIIVSGKAGTQGQSEYRLAGGDVAPAVMGEVDKRMVGDPLSPADERTLMASGWRTGH